MKKTFAIVLILVCGVASASVPALLLPREGAVVPILNEGQRSFFDSSDAFRKDALTNLSARAEWVAFGWYPRPVTFVWDGINSRKERLRFRIWREDDGVCVCDTNFVYLTTGRFEWDNFRTACGYRWEVDVAGKGCAKGTFRTEDRPPRLLRDPGIPNLRDLGGWKTADGRRVKQGLLYRSANLCENADECPDGKVRLRTTPETRRYLSEDLGIRTELDLRTPKECRGLESSPIGDAVRRVEISSGCYAQMKEPWAKEALRKDLELILDAKNLPILFHCSGGRDRTGALAFIVNGLLGVSEEDLARDWDATALWDTEHDWYNRDTSYAQLLAVMNGCPGKTLNARIEAYVESVGFGKDGVVRLRALLLEE